MKVKNCILSVFGMALGISSLVGLVGLIIYIGLWWGRIRYDFPYYKNDNTEAYNLYLAVLFSWVLPIVAFSSASIARVPECCGCKFFSTLLVTLTIWSGLAEFVVVILVIVWSTPSKCQIIEQKGTDPGKNTSEYIDWYNRKTEKMSEEEKAKFAENLPNYRCDYPHKMVIIYASLFVGAILLSFIFVLFTMWCNNENHPELEQLTDDTKREFGII